MKQLNTSKYNLLISLFLLWGCTENQPILVLKVAKTTEVKQVQLDTINYINNALEHLKSHEGYRANYYKGAAGCRLIGYGHKQLKGETFKELTLDLAHELLKSDFTTHLALVEINYPSFSHKQHVALSLFSFNLGSGALRKAVSKGITTDRTRWLKYCHYRTNGKLIKSKRLEERRIFETKLFFKL